MLFFVVLILVDVQQDLENTSVCCELGHLREVVVVLLEERRMFDQQRKNKFFDDGMIDLLPPGPEIRDQLSLPTLFLFQIGPQTVSQLPVVTTDLLDVGFRVWVLAFFE